MYIVEMMVLIIPAETLQCVIILLFIANYYCHTIIPKLPEFYLILIIN